MTDSGTIAEDLRASIGHLVRAARTADTLAPGETAALGYLDRGGPQTTAELARRRGVRHQSAARTVKALAEAGLVRTESHPTDGRKMLLHLTSEGSVRLAAERRARADTLAAAIDAALDPAEREELARGVELLRTLACHLRQE